MDVLQVFLVLGILHLLVDGVVHGLQRVEHSLHGVRQQGSDRVGDGHLLRGLLGGLLLDVLLKGLLHTVETLIGGLSGLVELFQHILRDSQIHTLT